MSDVRGFLVGLNDEAERLERFGAAGQARAVRAAAELVTLGLQTWWNEPLSMADAAEWGGYSEGQLRRLVREHKLAVAPNGGLRRRDVPVQPGHSLPLGLEPAPVATGDVIANLVERRQIGRAG